MHCTTSSWHTNAATTTSTLVHLQDLVQDDLVRGGVRRFELALCDRLCRLVHGVGHAVLRSAWQSQRPAIVNVKHGIYWIMDTCMDMVVILRRAWLHESHGVQRALTKDVLVEHAPHGSQCTAGDRTCEHRRAGSRPHACSACPNSLASQTVFICCHAGKCGLARGAPEVSGLRMTSRKGAMYSSGSTALQSATNARKTPS